MTAGLELEAGIQIAAGLAQEMRADRDWKRRVAGALSQVPFAGSVTLSSGAGTLDQPDLFQAKTGFYWSVRRLTAVGWTSGAVTAYKNSTNGEPVAPYPSPSVFTFGRGELLLNPGDRLVFAATGITGTVSVWGAADCFETWYLPFYIG